MKKPWKKGNLISRVKIKYYTLFFLALFSSCRVSKEIVYFDESETKKIIAGIKKPIDAQYLIDLKTYFPDKSGLKDSRPAFLEALKEIKQKNGAVLTVKAGNYRLNGPLHLESNLHLKLEKGAILNFTPEASFYLPAVKVRWEGTVCWNYSPLIYAYKKQNITISGDGIINGSGLEWSQEWRKKQKDDQTKLRKFGNDLIPENQRIFAAGQADTDMDGKTEGDNQEHFLRPGLVHLFDCEQIMINGNTFQNSPFWTMNFPFTDHLTIKNVKIIGGPLNDDGIDPDSSQEVLIENCDIDTHDDAISIKAGRDQDAWNRPGSKNIVIRNCKLKSQTNSFCIGSEMSGGVENVYVQNCVIGGAEYAINFKSNLDRGGEVKNIFIKDLKINKVTKNFLNFSMAYHSWRGNNFPTKFHKVYLENIVCNEAKETAFSITGVKESLISDIYLKNLVIKNALKDFEFTYTQNINIKNVKVNGK